jgi:hypothetical protein
MKYICVLLLVMAFAAPAFAQDDYPQFEIALGYGNIGVKDINSGRHSGFATHQAFNLNSRFAIENYVGYYGFGTDPSSGAKMQLLTDTFGMRVNYRTAGPVLYAAGGLGGGWLRFPDYGVGTNSAFTVRIGGGVDIPFHDSLAWKVDISRMAFHFNGWNGGTNISTGIVLKISQ